MSYYLSYYLSFFLCAINLLLFYYYFIELQIQFFYVAGANVVRATSTNTGYVHEILAEQCITLSGVHKKGVHDEHKGTPSTLKV